MDENRSKAVLWLEIPEDLPGADREISPCRAERQSIGRRKPGRPREKNKVKNKKERNVEGQEMTRKTRENKRQQEATRAGQESGRQREGERGERGRAAKNQEAKTKKSTSRAKTDILNLMTTEGRSGEERAGRTRESAAPRRGRRRLGGDLPDQRLLRVALAAWRADPQPSVC